MEVRNVDVLTNSAASHLVSNMLVRVEEVQVRLHIG